MCLDAQNGMIRDYPWRFPGRGKKGGGTSSDKPELSGQDSQRIVLHGETPPFTTTVAFAEHRCQGTRLYGTAA